MSRTPSRRGLGLVTLFAGALLAVGIVFAIDSRLLTGTVPALEGILASVDPGLILLGATLLLVVFAPTLGVAGKLRSRRMEPLVDSIDRNESDRRRRESETTARVRPSAGRGWDVLGASFDRSVDRATDYDGDREVRSRAREELIGALRPIAARAYANRAGVVQDDATRAIERGSWTDDPRAAAFLADESGPSTPIWLWLFDLVTATDPFSKSLERTVDEIEAIQATATITPRDEDGDGESGTDGNEDHGESPRNGDGNPRNGDEGASDGDERSTSDDERVRDSDERVDLEGKQ
ncbi:hypothetical protein AB7C87_12150 [Natrarchaeobius sp. A-rgal3]|uniref:DUF7269 family protein n=1 Tax=Natrarchaeobius versutus TaxID=1679078 RepID=UPI0035105B1A